MRVISKKPFNDAAKKYPNDRDALDRCHKVLKSNNFKSPADLREFYSSADNFKYKEKWWVIDIGGNNLRLLAFIEFHNNVMYIKHIVNHQDYDRLTAKYRKEFKKKG